MLLYLFIQYLCSLSNVYLRARTCECIHYIVFLTVHVVIQFDLLPIRFSKKDCAGIIKGQTLHLPHGKETRIREPRPSFVVVLVKWLLTSWSLRFLARRAVSFGVSDTYHNSFESNCNTSQCEAKMFCRSHH